MFIGSAVLLVYWLLTRVSQLPLVMAAVAAVWGGLWVILQHRANRDTEREVNAPPYRQPAGKHVVIISKATYRFRQGLLVYDGKGLVWLGGFIKAEAGDHLEPEHSQNVATRRLLNLEDLAGFTHRATIMGWAVLELRAESGEQFRLRLKDPEGFRLLLELLDQS